MFPFDSAASAGIRMACEVYVLSTYAKLTLTFPSKPTAEDRLPALSNGSFPSLGWIFESEIIGTRPAFRLLGRQHRISHRHFAFRDTTPLVSINHCHCRLFI